MKQQFYLKGFTCANCAVKLESRLAATDGFSEVNFNLGTQKLTFTSVREYRTSDIQTMVDAVESGVLVQALHEAHDEPDHLGSLKFLLPAIALYGVAWFVKIKPLQDILFIGAFLLTGHSVIWRALKNIKQGDLFDENFLMSIATIGAFAIGEFPEGAAVMIFYQIGEYFQGKAVDHSRRSIAQMMNLRVERVHRLEQGSTVDIAPEEVTVGDRLLLKPGEKVALDGVVRSGRSLMYTANITGESVPRTAAPGDRLLSGFVNGDGTLEMEVEKPYSESTIAKILELVENASAKKAQTEQFITRFSKIYTPIVVVIAALMAVFMPMILQQDYSTWVYRALIFLVISCPCALVLSVPLSYFAGLGATSKHGLVVKGGNYLEALDQARILVLDKTGTLTKGAFVVQKISPAPGVSEEELLREAALAESQSTHPIATSIVERYGTRQSTSFSLREYSGEGLLTDYGVAVGNDKLMKRLGVVYAKEKDAGTVVYVAKDGHYLGSILISDTIKTNIAHTIHALKELGIKRIIMLSGDHRSSAEQVAEHARIDEVHAELLPQDKVAKLEQLKAEHPGEKVIFVGDGTNDAPVLAAADLGIAMGDIGSDAALEAADMVLMRGELSDLTDGLRIAKRTKQIVWQNIIFSLGAKFVVLLLGALGFASMWAAVFADVGVALIAVLNSLRILNTKTLGESK